MKMNYEYLQLMEEIREIKERIKICTNSLEKLILENKELNPRLLTLGKLIMKEHYNDNI